MEQTLVTGSSARIGFSGRDVIYSEEAVKLIETLDKSESGKDNPWLMVASFVNPHDITLFGELTEKSP
ncbi:hypothetical protein GCM10011391_03150 [Pullulanibacillus camelliae]|uniref:Uncharacterized protein n=1 Tax=Pullulanibacillus camelliae TaxID=1707096 RepID=A0A8J2VF14_9BACL|nr:hypothetical protein GCM10011391_03150 [Pullulanibacillus camelliae]